MLFIENTALAFIAAAELNDIGRCHPRGPQRGSRAGDPVRVGRRNCALPVRTLPLPRTITSSFQLGPLTASAVVAYPTVTDRGHRDRREGTFTAQLLKCETGRPLRLAAPDAVQPLFCAAVVPADGGR